MKSIAVFCGSSLGTDEFIAQQAYQLGEILAKQHISLVYGGAKIGIMGKVAQGVLDHQGKVIGVIPEFLKIREVFHPHLTELITTNTMHERKSKMYELSDGIITLAGGYGTLEELFEMITWAQLGLHQKPIGILNTNGFYDHLFALLQQMVDQGFLKQNNFDMLLADHTIQGLLSKMNNYMALPVPKWLKTSQT